MISDPAEPLWLFAMGFLCGALLTCAVWWAVRQYLEVRELRAIVAGAEKLYLEGRA